MKKVLIIGASGMIGGIVLRECISSEEIETVTLIVRKPLDTRSPKVTEVHLEDFCDYSPIREYMKDIDVAYFCLGAYTGSVSDEEFRKITVDYARAFADMLQSESPGATLCFLSGAGADRTEQSKIPFARYKGMAENILLAHDFSRLFIFHPGYIYPVRKRVEPNMMYRIFRVLYPVIQLVYPQGVITSEVLGRAMYRLGLSEGSSTTLDNETIKKFGQSTS